MRHTRAIHVSSDIEEDITTSSNIFKKRFDVFAISELLCGPEYGQYSTSPKTPQRMCLHDMSNRTNQTRMPHTWRSPMYTNYTNGDDALDPCRVSCTSSPSSSPAASACSAPSYNDARHELRRETGDAPLTGPRHTPAA